MRKKTCHVNHPCMKFLVSFIYIQFNIFIKFFGRSFYFKARFYCVYNYGDISSRRFWLFVSKWSFSDFSSNFNLILENMNVLGNHHWCDIVRLIVPDKKFGFHSDFAKSKWWRKSSLITSFDNNEWFCWMLSRIENNRQGRKKTF